MSYPEPLDRAGVGYRRIKRQSHRGLAVILAVGVMAMCASGLWIAYKVSSRQSSPDNVPLIHADNHPTKVRPEAPGGMQIPNQDKLVFTGTAPVEKLLPPPEAPLPRPAPPPESGTQAAITPLPPAAPAIMAQPTPLSPMTITPPATAQSNPPQTASRPPAPVPNIDGKGYRLQIGSVKTSEGARQEWERLKRANADVLGSLGFSAERADLGDRGIFYRIQAGPIADGTAAERACSELRHRNVGCILVKP